MPPVCRAPVFNGVVSPPSNGNIVGQIIVLIILAFVGGAICVVVGLPILLVWLFWSALSPFSATARCRRKQAMFRLRHCIFGNSDPNIML